MYWSYARATAASAPCTRSAAARPLAGVPDGTWLCSFCAVGAVPIPEQLPRPPCPVDPAIPAGNAARAPEPATAARVTGRQCGKCANCIKPRCKKKGLDVQPTRASSKDGAGPSGRKDELATSTAEADSTTALSTDADGVLTDPFTQYIHFPDAATLPRRTRSSMATFGPAAAPTY